MVMQAGVIVLVVLAEVQGGVVVVVTGGAEVHPGVMDLIETADVHGEVDCTVIEDEVQPGVEVAVTTGADVQPGR